MSAFGLSRTLQYADEYLLSTCKSGHRKFTRRHCLLVAYLCESNADIADGHACPADFAACFAALSHRLPRVLRTRHRNNLR